MEYEFVLTGTMPLLMHQDDVEQADALKRWRDDPANKSVSVPGDDRSPPWTWQTYLYSDGTHLVVPADNIMACLRGAAAKIPHKKGATFKAMSQSSLLIGEEFCEFRSAGERVAMAPIVAMRDATFAEQAQKVKALNFVLYVKRAKISQSKHIRVRPRFNDWAVAGTIESLDPAITTDVLTSMFQMAGRYVGLLDWRPGSPKAPGSFGMFTAEIKPIKGGKK